MGEPTLERVFTISGVPTFTFVEPKEYAKLLVALRTPGRGVVVEGPSGIGKTSAVETALKKLYSSGITVTKLSARKPADVEYIEHLPTLGGVGTVIIDDFHRLTDTTKKALADYLKTLADEAREDVKVVIIGINRAGERLISFASDLVNRIEIIQLGTNPEHKVRELVALGETALNVQINVADEIVSASEGSFYIAQLLAHEVCLASKVLERSDEAYATAVSFEAIRASVWDRLKLRFDGPCRIFCQGPRMKQAGRAPYLNVLRGVAQAQEWSVHVLELARSLPTARDSIIQVVQKNYLRDLLSSKATELGDLLHFDEGGKRLTVEDPQFVFFLKDLPWATFARQVGFLSVDFERRYDFALSFAGVDREIAQMIAEVLTEEEIHVFYDKNEQHRILAEDVEEYLRPIYQSEANYVICLLGPEYPKRIWTKFESDSFKDRFKTGEVIPIWFTTAQPGMFDESRRVGGVAYDPAKDRDTQVRDICKLLVAKLGDKRSQPPPKGETLLLFDKTPQ